MTSSHITQLVAGLVGDGDVEAAQARAEVDRPRRARLERGRGRDEGVERVDGVVVEEVGDLAAAAVAVDAAQQFHHEAVGAHEIVASPAGRVGQPRVGVVEAARHLVDRGHVAVLARTEVVAGLGEGAAEPLGVGPLLVEVDAHAHAGIVDALARRGHVVAGAAQARAAGVRILDPLVRRVADVALVGPRAVARHHAVHRHVVDLVLRVAGRGREILDRAMTQLALDAAREVLGQQIADRGRVAAALEERARRVAADALAGAAGQILRRDRDAGPEHRITRGVGHHRALPTEERRIQWIGLVRRDVAEAVAVLARRRGHQRVGQLPGLRRGGVRGRGCSDQHGERDRGHRAARTVECAPGHVGSSRARGRHRRCRSARA
jgi:hypothetical protein